MMKQKALSIFVMICIFQFGGSTQDSILCRLNQIIVLLIYGGTDIVNRYFQLFLNINKKFTKLECYWLIFQIQISSKLYNLLHSLLQMPTNQDKPASFIGKLYNILRSKEHAKIIYWDHEEKGIRILNQKKLEEIILPKYFRHNRFSSFVRQLNMYDFHKVHLPDHRSIFCHSQFDPKKKENIHLIRRKVTFEQKTSSDRQPDRNLEDITSQKQNTSVCDAFFKSSKNMLYKQSLRNFFNQKTNNTDDVNQQEILEELIQVLIPLKSQKVQFEQKIKNFKTNKKYRRFLKKQKFASDLYARLGIDWVLQKDSLSQLSIEDELVFKTKKSLPQKSLKYLESGQLYFKRQTMGNFWNF